MVFYRGILTFLFFPNLGGPPTPTKINPFDTPDDYFRIRLISTILETCGMYFNRGAAGKKLDYFLSFFQYYIHTKPPLPMDIEFIVQDIFALTRPQWKLATNLEEASKAFQLAIAQDQKSSGADKAGDMDDGTSGDSSDDENADELALVEPDDDEESGSDDAEEEVRISTPPPYLCQLRASNLLTRTNLKNRIRNNSPTARANLKMRQLLSPGRKKKSIPKTRPNSNASTPRW